MRTKLNILILAILAFPLNLYSQHQNRLADRIYKAQIKNEKFDNFELFTKVKQEENKKHKSLKNPQYLKLGDIDCLKSSHYLTLDIPYKDSILTVELERVSISFNSYTVKTSSGKEHKTNQENQFHYRGIVKGNEENSLVALSFFYNEAAGFISVQGMDIINISKVKNSDNHVIFSNDELKDASSRFSSADGDQSTDEMNPLLADIYDNIMTLAYVNPYTTTDPEDAFVFNIYVETVDSMYIYFNNSITAVENYVSSLFNQVASIYAIENIFINISEIFVWDTGDPYSDAPSIHTGLSEFVNNRNNFEGDVAVLLDYRKKDYSNTTENAKGKANGFGGVCVSGNNSLSPHSYVTLHPEFLSFPNYSRQVKVVTHEIGHNLGSRHTHACVWSESSLAIDGCVFPEGSCGQPSVPSEGTIMSYCDYNEYSQVNFTLGFGPQPGAVIRNFLKSVHCLDISITNWDITMNTRFYGSYVHVGNVDIDNNSDMIINYSNDVIINGTFEINNGSTFELIIR